MQGLHLTADLYKRRCDPAWLTDSTPKPLQRVCAAAMGLPAVLLANHAAERRWKKQPTASPWYPDVFIASAPWLGAWEAAAGMARDALRRQFSERRSTAACPLPPVV